MKGTISVEIKAQMKILKFEFHKTWTSLLLTWFGDGAQMAKMASGDAEEARREAICASLEQWLAVQFPGCRIQPFGSVVSGLASRTSDLDLYVSLPPGPCTITLVEPPNSRNGRSHRVLSP